MLKPPFFIFIVGELCPFILFNYLQFFLTFQRFLTIFEIQINCKDFFFNKKVTKAHKNENIDNNNLSFNQKVQRKKDLSEGKNGYIYQQEVMLRPYKRCVYTSHYMWSTYVISIVLLRLFYIMS